MGKVKRTPNDLEGMLFFCRTKAQIPKLFGANRNMTDWAGSKIPLPKISHAFSANRILYVLSRDFAPRYYIRPFQGQKISAKP